MARHGAQIAGSDAARDWQALREAGDIQFAPLPPVEPPKTPDWLSWLGKLLEALFGPLGEALGLSWPVVEPVLIAALIMLAIFLLWRLAIAPMLEARRLRQRAEPEEWIPDRDAATALLEEADRLAAQGRFAEATHLLLQRSVDHIVAARPEWLISASTAREIAALPLLPARAREAFSAIATRVERSLFALRDLDREDWRAARAAYADFALADFAS